MQRHNVVKQPAIAQQNLVTKKNPMVAELKYVMAEEGNNLKLMWVPVHIGIKENKETDKVEKESLEQEVETTHNIVIVDWSGWTRTKKIENRQNSLLESGNYIIRRKPDITSTMNPTRRQQVMLSRLRICYIQI
jgi:hypothetical protein